MSNTAMTVLISDHILPELDYGWDFIDGINLPPFFEGILNPFPVSPEAPISSLIPSIFDFGDGSLTGDSGANSLIGGSGNDRIEGKDGNDTLNGSSGNDTLIGTDSLASWFTSLFGITSSNEVDTLTGGTGADTFVLGAASLSNWLGDSLLAGSFHTIGSTGVGSFFIQNHGYYERGGINDYALITDFDPAQDTIRLAGSASDYTLGQATAGLPAGAAIYKGTASNNELIAILQNTQVSSFNSGFSFVNATLPSYFTFDLVPY